MGQPDPSHIGRVDDEAQRGNEVPVRQPETGIDHDGFPTAQHERVDIEESDAGHLQVVVENGDIGADAVHGHVLLPTVGGSSSNRIIERLTVPRSVTVGW
jgi:hypothetical protein